MTYQKGRKNQMKILDKTFKFNFIDLLKTSLLLIGLGAMISLLNEGLGWIVAHGIIFLAVFEVSSMFYAYKNKDKKKKTSLKYSRRKENKKEC